MRIHVAVSVFSSPSEAFGSASGTLDLSALPDPSQPFPWPMDWVKEKPAFFSADQSRFMLSGEINGLPFALLNGIVCWSPSEALECASFLEQHGGLFFDEYETAGRRHGV
jgi:hypothetical protein